jgi:hypothetical protein
MGTSRLGHLLHRTFGGVDLHCIATDLETVGIQIELRATVGLDATNRRTLMQQ